MTLRQFRCPNRLLWRCRLKPQTDDVDKFLCIPLCAWAPVDTLGVGMGSRKVLIKRVRYQI